MWPDLESSHHFTYNRSPFDMIFTFWFFDPPYILKNWNRMRGKKNRILKFWKPHRYQHKKDIDGAVPDMRPLKSTKHRTTLLTTKPFGPCRRSVNGPTQIIRPAFIREWKQKHTDDGFVCAIKTKIKLTILLPLFRNLFISECIQAG